EAEFGNDEASLHNLVRQFAMSCRIYDIQAGTYHGNRGTASLECTAVCGAIDTQRHAADNTESMLAQGSRKIFGILFALRCCVAAAHDGHAARIEQIRVALGVEQWRRIGDFQ